MIYSIFELDSVKQINIETGNKDEIIKEIKKIGVAKWIRPEHIYLLKRKSGSIDVHVQRWHKRPIHVITLRPGNPKRVNPQNYMVAPCL